MSERKNKGFIKGAGIVLLVSYISQGGVTLGMPEDFFQNTLAMVSENYIGIGLGLLVFKDKKPPNKPSL
ncbi:hypothetical protein [Peribacillus sp. V2I11]|uniref:hypothetical protein n=1 Tax=Peribacillus sp. V2I11 TaxID=3042277 RepID=UPI0027896417|nr:hypothetical protein [Peribacillus sp. V2I11]MDQ0884907.1 hypothetical protein [Peribacillus sp. V2I11]